MKKNSSAKIVLFYIIIFVVVIVALSMMFKDGTGEKITVKDDPIFGLSRAQRGAFVNPGINDKAH